LLFGDDRGSGVDEGKSAPKLRHVVIAAMSGTLTGAPLSNAAMPAAAYFAAAAASTMSLFDATVQELAPRSALTDAHPSGVTSSAVSWAIPTGSGSIHELSSGVPAQAIRHSVNALGA
jgi:hypothetical protein